MKRKRKKRPARRPRLKSSSQPSHPLTRLPPLRAPKGTLITGWEKIRETAEGDIPDV